MIKKLLYLVTFCVFWISASAQSVIFDNVPPLVSDGNTAGGVCFNFTVQQPVFLDSVRCNLSATTGTATIWYNPNKINGQPVINAANGWINAGSVTVTGSASTTNRTAMTNIPVFLNLQVNPGDTIGIAIQWTGNNFPTTNVNIPTFTDGTVTMIADASCAYTFTSTMTTFYTPRQINGGVIYRMARKATNDIGVHELISPVNFCSGPQSIRVKIRNFGNNVVSSGTINWTLDGLAQTPVSLTSPLDSFLGAGPYDTIVTLGSHTFTNAPVTLKAWTSAPNGQPDTSNLNDTLIAVLQPSLSGYYTVNSTQPASGTNFQNITALTNALNTVGVCGPVVVDIVTGTGPYTGKVEFGNIPGSSNINTVRINGNGNTVNVASSATNGARELLLLDNTSYLTVDGLNFVSTGSAGWGALITNGSSYDSIQNCTFDLSSITSTASASNSGILFSGGNSAATTAGPSGKHMYIGNNHLIGSAGAGGLYYGISLNDNADSNTVQGNTVENYYYYGIYLAVNSGNRIISNRIERPRKTTGFTTIYPIYLASGASVGHLIDGNIIANMAAPSASNTSNCYGIYILADATAAQPIIVSNNLMYNVKAGLTYGVYLSTATNILVHHNTLDFGVATGSSSAVYGLYATGTNTGSQFMNNSVSITAGGTGTVYGFYYSAAASVSDAQKNNFYLNSSTAATQNYGYYTTAYPTRAAFIAAYPALEVNSPAAAPQYMNPALEDFSPLSSALIGAGMNLIASVPRDIRGNFRTAAPTIGAFERDLNIPDNLALIRLTDPNGIYCADTQGVHIEVANMGNTAISSFKITGTYNGTPLDTVTYNQALTTVVVNPATAIATVFFKDLPVSTAVNNLILWVVSVNDLPDGDNTNDTLTATLQGYNFTLASTADTLCANTTSRLTLSPGTAGNDIIWQSSPDGNTWNTISGANDSVYLATITNHTHYRVFVDKGLNGCYSDERYLFFTSPEITYTADSSVCAGGPVALVAQSSAGSRVNWYDNISAETPVHTGDTLDIPNLLGNTTFYAEAMTGNGPGNAGPLTPASVGTNSGTSSAYTTYYMSFDVLQSTTLLSVDIFPTAAINSSASIVILDPNQNIIATVPYTTTVTGGATAQTIPMNIQLPPGTGYRMGQAAGPIALSRNSAGASYPYTSDAISITGNNMGAGYYYYFYNWKFESGCKSARVPVNARIVQSPVVDLGSDINDCFDEGAYVFLNARNSGMAYTWDNGDTGQVRVIANSGRYWVHVANELGCFDTDTVNVTIKRNPVSLLGNDTVVCKNTPLVLDAGPNGMQYFWSNNTTSQTTTVRTSNTYRVNIIGDNGCTTIDSIRVDMSGNPPLYDKIQVQNLGINTFSFRLINAESIQSMKWNFGDGSSSYAASPTHTYASDGNYIVTLETFSNCGGKGDTITVHVKGLGIEDLDRNSQVGLYPNPAKDMITISCKNTAEKIRQISLLDISGRELRTLEDIHASETSMDVSQLTDGMYLIQVVTDAYVYKLKFNKAH
ncbi:MAG: hypothetical protein BGO09_16450 [Bacteroidetes bacterium 47-18]|nr:MAG: hypothetical protein BGO09_16450 [Bacteroidetes bacterium 47-18]